MQIIRNISLYLVAIIAFSSMCNVAFSQPYMLDQIVAIVGSKPIKQSDVEDSYLQARVQGFSMQGDMKCYIFEELLQEKLLLNQAEVDSLVVTNAEVDLQINQRLDAFIKQIGSQEKLEQRFNKSIYEIKNDLRKTMYENQMAQKMKGEIVKDVKITPSDVRSFYNKIPKDSIPLVNSQAEIAQLVMYPPYSEEAISEVRQKLLDLRRRVINGESFRTLAVFYSEEPGAARTGGEIGFASKGELDPAYVKAAWALKNPGDVSRIVESKYGYHIIQLVEKRGDQVNTRHILMTPKPNPEAVTTVVNRLDSILRLVRKDSLSWNTAVLKYSQDEDTRFNNGLMINPQSRGTLFEMTQLNPADYAVIKNMKVGEYSNPYSSVDNKNKPVYKIVKLTNLSDPHRANMKDDYNFLQQLAQQNKMMSTLTHWVDEKIASSYIYIEESFKRCKLSNNSWLR